MSRTLYLAAVLGVAATLLATSCGSSSSSSQATTPASTEASDTSSTESFTRSNWDVLASDPDAHKGARVDFVGRVFVTPERDKKGVYLQVWEDPQHSANNTIVGYARPDFRVAEDDYVHVTGTVEGAFKGKNAFGAEVTGTTVLADTVKVVDATAAAPPAIATLGPRSSTQAGITVTVRKVEFAASETRVFMAVKNESGSDANVYASSMKAVQAGRQYDPEFSSDYPDLSSELVSGVSTSGVVVFPALNPQKALKLILEVFSENSGVGNYGTLKYSFTWV